MKVSQNQTVSHILEKLLGIATGKQLCGFLKGLHNAGDVCSAAKDRFAGHVLQTAILQVGESGRLLFLEMCFAHVCSLLSKSEFATRTLTLSTLCFKFLCVVDLIQRLSNHTRVPGNTCWLDKTGRDAGSLSNL